MALGAERQEFVDDPLASSRGKSGSEKVKTSSEKVKAGSEDPSRTAFPKAPVIQLPHRDPGSNPAIEHNEEESESSLNEKAAAALRNAKESISRTYNQTKDRFAEAYGRVSESSSDLSQRAQLHARRMKDEQPLRLLAIIAGTAFVIGIALRLWRSNRYEQ